MGKVILDGRGPEDRNGAGTNSRKTGTSSLEDEIIRSRAQSTGGCVKLNTVTEIRRSSARFVLNSLLDCEPVERLKERSGVVSITSSFFSPS